MRVTVELLPFGQPATRTLGLVEIVNIHGDSAAASYEIRVYDEVRNRIATGQLDNYPRFATTVWDLVARGIATALAGKEELPPRPTVPRR